MTFSESKKDIKKQISTNVGILKEVPFYDYAEEKIFALEDVEQGLKGVKSFKDLALYSEHLKEISKEYGEQATHAKTKNEKDNCLGLKEGYRMGYLIITTELENQDLSGKRTTVFKRNGARK